MNDLDYIKQIQQQIRVIQGYEQILKNEVIKTQNLICYEKESIIRQLDMIKLLIHKSLQDIHDLEEYVYKNKKMSNFDYFPKQKDKKYVPTKHKKMYASYFDYMRSFYEK
ncbi:hypothetical protein BM86_24210 [Bacillus thuringiensis]|uniref:Uncharacterized protein n=1 Tax=Bacillus thuringiensis TaxID=1428 RepID=A0A9W3SIV5_BACTU|nr:hypothetical protein [Bacillus thuringiensis]ANS52221.1 hypothetical protein BT246_69300 [Bacillus thuringiensis]MBH0338501.1 hypothetical protein [Bacillus thuringiensis]